MREEYYDYFQDILNYVKAIEEFVIGITFEEFKNDQKTIFAVIRGIEVIGEAARKIPRAIRNEYPHVPWGDITGMRDKLIHDYSNVDFVILWETVKHDLPILKAMISQIINGF